jgi:hypothetical protein
LLSTISRAALESFRSRSAASRHSTSAAADQFSTTSSRSS